MTEPPHTPAAHPGNAPHHAKAAGKGLMGKLKGHNKYVYIAGAVILLGMAYLAWHRSTTTEASGDAMGPDPTDGSDIAADSGYDAAPGYSGGGGGAGNYGGTDDPGQGYASEPQEIDVLFGAAPAVDAVPTNSGGTKTPGGKHKRPKHPPTGGGPGDKRDPAKHHHPHDDRHPAKKAAAKKAAAAAGAAAGQAAAQAGKRQPRNQHPNGHPDAKQHNQKAAAKKAAARRPAHH